jgi:hypothetical protein
MLAVYRQWVRTYAIVAPAMIALLGSVACTSVDPGPQFVVPDEHFDANYFFCHVEPQLIIAKQCGDDGSGACHYSGKIPAMALVPLASPVDCGGGETPVDLTQIGPGSPPASNLAAVSLEMSTDYTTAPIYIWPTQIVSSHPKRVFDTNDPVVQVIATWAQK